MYNPYIGICKFIMALLVVAIHVRPFGGDFAFYYNDCLARIADPMFFTLSAYFLFDKLLKNNWDRDIFWKQIKRLLGYYGIWLLVYSPVIGLRTWEHCNGALEFLWQIIRQIALTGPYGALWFLPALILGLLLTYWLGGKTNASVSLILSCPFFLFTVAEMEYFHLVKDIDWLNSCNALFVSIFGWLGNGLNYGFFFCALGFYLASTKELRRSFFWDVTKLAIASILLILECTLIRKFDLGISYGAMGFLIFVTYYLMRVLLALPKQFGMENPVQKYKPQSSQITITFEKTSRFLQDLSLLIFPLHYGIMELLQYLLQNQDWYIHSWLLPYILVITVTCVISTIILLLGSKLRFFRFFYGKQ